MARMRNMAMKPVSWVKKHWVKTLVAIMVIYAIYWLFIKKNDNEHMTRDEITDLKKTMDAAKADWDDAKKAENDVKDGTLTDPKCSSNNSPSITRGCIQYTLSKKSAYDAAKTAYDPYAPKKSKKSLKSKIRKFFGMKN
jgi:hypothetical protein